MTTVLIADSALVDYRNALAVLTDEGVPGGPVMDLLVDALRHVAAFFARGRAGGAPLVRRPTGLRPESG